MTTIPYPRRFAVLALVPLLALGLAACAGDGGGDDGIASVDPAARPSAEASATGAPLDDEERQLKFAQCMRENGVPMEDPDSDGDGGVRIRVGGGVKPEAAEAAMEKCKAYAPNGGKPIQLDAEQLAKLREFSKCMRANGVPDFPDPDPSGRITMRRYRGLDTEEKAFEEAQEKCRQFQPEPRRSGAPQ
jgi:hypothetical protein